MYTQRSTLSHLTWALLAAAAWVLHAAPAPGATPAPPAITLEPDQRAGWPNWPPAARGRSLSGSLQRSASSPLVLWDNFEGACFTLKTDPSLYGKKTEPTGDSGDVYSPGTLGGGYDCGVQPERLWHLTTGPPGMPTPIIGTRSLWMGKYDPIVNRIGYPANSNLQILFIRTGAVRNMNYTLSFKLNSGCAAPGDWLYVLADGTGPPLGRDATRINNVIANGSDGTAQLLVRFSNSITATTSIPNPIVTPAANPILGAPDAEPATRTITLSINKNHQAVYFVFRSDGESSSLDGSWPHGTGVLIDDVTASDAGSIYAEQSDAGLGDEMDHVIVGTVANPIVSARVPTVSTTCYAVVAGATAPTSDYCSVPKNNAGDHFFWAADPGSHLTLPDTRASLQTCSFPLTAGTGRVITSWSQYMDLPRGSGMVQSVEYRYFRTGAWSGWGPASPSRPLAMEGGKAWSRQAEDLPLAALADSVQIRYSLECAPWLTQNGGSCLPVSLGLMYDDLGLMEISGIPAEPMFAVFPGGVLQSTFVDGTMTGTNCTVAPCWPGVRGSELPLGIAIDDNVNTPLGDSMVVHLQSALRPAGMGINWNQGFDKSVNGGRTIARANGGFEPMFGAPQVLYRLFDPATKTWSPIDSTELDADNVLVASGDTTAVGDAFRFDWPPRDKAGLSLPGGFTVNGVGAYNSLRFLPRGTRLQYYFKLVDVSGAVRYQFQSDAAGLEAADLPTLPGGTARAPDILEFDVLPGRYAVGSGGSLLAGRTTTPILHVDAGYGGWSFRLDPMTQALRALGVRADRYRVLPAIDLGNNVGGRATSGSPLFGNYFPNLNDYAIAESLAQWYRVILLSSHQRTNTPFSDADGRLLASWWVASTGTNGGDRCVFGSGDHLYDNLLNPAVGSPDSFQIYLAQGILGVGSATGSWSGTGMNLIPTIDNRFAGGGPGLGGPGSYTYPLDGGCAAGQRQFDALTPSPEPDVYSAVFFPGSVQTAGVARLSELDIITDKDRSKSIGYGYSIQFVRKAGIPINSPPFAHAGVMERMATLYKFLASCRGARTGSPADTGICWPCPTDANMTGNWGSLAGFQAGTYGPLYQMQDYLAATGVEVPSPGSPRVANALLQNRPNPFNPETTIPYSLAAPGRVEIRVFDVSGRMLRTLVSGVKPAGLHSVRWNGQTDGGGHAASGVYFYRITYPDGSVSAKKLTILR